MSDQETRPGDDQDVEAHRHRQDNAAGGDDVEAHRQKAGREAGGETDDEPPTSRVTVTTSAARVPTTTSRVTATTSREAGGADDDVEGHHTRAANTTRSLETSRRPRPAGRDGRGAASTSARADAALVSQEPRTTSPSQPPTHGTPVRSAHASRTRRSTSSSVREGEWWISTSRPTSASSAMRSASSMVPWP